MAHQITRPRTTEDRIAVVDIADEPGRVELTLESSFMLLASDEARQIGQALIASADEADAKAAQA